MKRTFALLPAVVVLVLLPWMAQTRTVLAQAESLTAQPWQWVAYAGPVEQFDVETPERYVVTFTEEGAVSIVADCNNAAGSYTADEGALTITVGPMTMAACPPDSRSDQFVALLGGAARYFFEDGQLLIDLMADGGTLSFASAGDAGSIAEEAAGAGLQLDPDTEQVTPPPALSVRERGITEVPCALGMPNGPDEVEGETYFCGIFTVPMRWEDPDSPNIDLHFIVDKATGASPEPDPLLFLAGGPGQSAVVLDPSATYAQVRQHRDIVRLDQRGTGLSQRLSLEECLVLAVKDPEAADEVAALVQFIQAGSAGDAQQNTASATDLDFDLKTRQLCARQFTNQGLDLDAFTSAQSARDLVALLQALGYESFNVHGLSYGTRLAMTLMAMLPQIEDAPELRSVVLDSTLPPSVYLLSSLPRYRHDPVMQMLAECEQDETCRSAYPNLTNRLGALLANLEAEPLTAGDETITLEDLVQVLTDLSGLRAGYMPLLIAELEAGKAETYLALRDRSVGSGDPEGAMSFDTSDPVQAFLANAVALLGAGGELGPVVEFLVDTSGLLAADEPLEALQAYIDASFEDDLRAGLAEELAAVTAEDFENSSYVAQMRAAAATQPVELTPEEQAARQLRSQRTLALVGLSYFLNMNIHCNEDYQFERYEDGLNVYHDLTFPPLGDLDFLRSQSTTCESWPVTVAPIEVKNPVSSTVPTLILQGAYDNRTPVYMGRRAARELANSTLAIVPQQGHEVWKDANNCAGRIAAAFVADPAQELDLSCLDGRLPQWVLPAAGVDDGAQN